MRAEPLQQLPAHMSYAPWQPPQALQAPLLLPNVCEANGCVQVCTCPSLLTDKQSSESCSTGMCTIMPFWMSSQGCATMAQCKAVVPHNLTTMRLLQALSAMLDSAAEEAACCFDQRCTCHANTWWRHGGIREYKSPFTPSRCRTVLTSSQSSSTSTPA